MKRKYTVHYTFGDYSEFTGYREQMWWLRPPFTGYMDLVIELGAPIK